MKIVCISDTHGYHGVMTHPIPEGDVLVVAGDFTQTGSKAQVLDFNEWLKDQPCKHKVVVAGNHDWCFENKKRGAAPGWISEAIYLQDQGTVIDGVKFYGTPWQPEFGNWAFNLRRGKELRDKWDAIHGDTDVLITHGPPDGIMDLDRDGDPVGCEDLRDRVLELRPELHVFGHIHSGHGWTIQDGITYVNASVCNEAYEAIQAPIVVEV